MVAHFEMLHIPVIVILCLMAVTSNSQILEIINQPMVGKNVYEKEGTRFEIQCITCTGGVPPYSISRVSVNPAFDTCSNCFEVYDNINGHPPDDFCLYYQPSQGPLNYKKQPGYMITVSCLDSTDNTTQAIIDVRVRTNEPPTFNTAGSFKGTCSFSALTTLAGQVIPNPSPWNPRDPDGDPLTFSMTVQPSKYADLFKLDTSTGNIRAVRDMKELCHPSVTFTLNVKDTEGHSIGPYVATCNVPDAYVPPSISNVNKVISVPESTAVNSPLVQPYLRTTPFFPPVTFDIATNPQNALNFINITFAGGVPKLILINKLDFESPGTQNFNISIRPQNGYCDAITHFLYVQTTDANDQPRLNPTVVNLAVNEGGIVVNPAWLLVEVDNPDTVIYSIVGGNSNNKWSIDPSTGIISSNGIMDLDPNVIDKNFTLVVQVEDNAGAFSNATVHILVEDINDNRPRFTQAVYQVNVMDCAGPRNIGQVLVATDRDSSHNDNNLVYFEEVENDVIKIFNDGTAQIKSVPPLGTTSSVSTFALDQGKFPGPLRSLTSGSVIVTTIPCTTTTSTTTVTPANTNTNKTSNSTSNSNSNSNANANANANAIGGVNSLVNATALGANAAGTGFADIFLWSIAGLLGLFLLGLLAYLIFRHCANFCTGTNSWANCCQSNEPPRHVRPFSQDRGISRQKEDFKPAQKVVEEDEDEEIIESVPQPPVIYGNAVVPQAKVQRYLRVRRLVPIKPQQVRVKSLVPIPANQPYQPVTNPPSNTLASYLPAPTGTPTGVNTKPVQSGVNK